ncbi:hypothetical protein BG011_008578 [Mortierella polycephala]|uniref:DUF1746 domain-containing protein n=1 Tax=Mortierella polycephala TaxID=41804 RepID=A0A9P6PQ84_9FUNG|nr:hypothetical protein BG011_008578 [Mortierella polycephala]
MSNLYYKKDIHKSIEGLLYSLFVYQYLLDTSTIGLLARCLVQDQLLSLKSKAPTLRIAIYIIIATALLAFLRHLHAPERYAVIIDFIGNVSTPGWSKLFWLDVLIVSLQVVEALIVFNFIKADDSTRRTATLDRRSSRRSAVSGHRPAEVGGATSLGNDVSGSISQSQASAAGSSRDITAVPLSSSTGVSSTQPSSPLFEYTPQHTNGSDQDDLAAEYYVDHEEIRYSEDNDRRPSGSQSQSQSRRARHHSSDTENTSSSRTDERRRRRRSSNSSSSNGSSDDSDDDDDEDPLGDDYEEILEQETFVLQVQFKDLVSYLFSGQEAVSFPRIPDPRTAASSSAFSANTHASDVRTLPV